MATVIVYPVGRAALQAILDTHLKKQAEDLANTLHDHLGRAGSGKHHKGQPNRSSAPGEYPAKQTADLQGSVAARRVTAGHYRIGFWNAPPYAIGVEFKPPSRGGRAPIRKFMVEVKAMP